MSSAQHIRNGLTALSVAAAMTFATAASAAINYSQDFEAMEIASDPSNDALADDGWVVGANVFNSDGSFAYQYFDGDPAPNSFFAFSSVTTGEGGDEQGDRQLAVYNDYANEPAHTSGQTVQAFVFQERTLDASDIDTTVTFDFEGKQGNREDPSVAVAFVKVLRSSDGSFEELVMDSIETTNIGDLWGYFSLSIAIDASLEGELLQFGFWNTASNYGSSGMIYDNINVSNVPLPAAVWLMVSGLAGLLGFGRRRKD